MSDTPAFPPDEIGAFLRFCEGEWMSLRSHFALDDSAPQAGAMGDEWHSSERGELRWTFLEPASGRGPGGLRVGVKDQPGRDLHFSADGCFSSQPPGAGPQDPPAQEGRWTLWPDGSLELQIRQGPLELSERIWFTKPNLRLRSTMERHSDGRPGRASFSSEIRRVSRPAAAG